MARSPRLLRNWRGREVYHVYQRGNRRQNVFPDAASYLSYLKRFFMLVLRYNVRVHAFCLMPNHVHFVLEPNNKRGLSAFMRDLQAGHARWLHTRLGTNGHAWKHHFGCKRLDAAHYRTAMWYVENNPVRARLTRRADLWPYSSAASHISNRPVTLARKGRVVTIKLWTRRWQEEFGHLNWAAWLQNPAEEDLRQRVAAVEDVLGSDRSMFGITKAIRKLPERRRPTMEIGSPSVESAAAAPTGSPRRC